MLRKTLFNLVDRNSWCSVVQCPNNMKVNKKWCYQWLLMITYHYMKKDDCLGHRNKAKNVWNQPSLERGFGCSVNSVGVSRFDTLITIILKWSKYILRSIDLKLKQKKYQINLYLYTYNRTYFPTIRIRHVRFCLQNFFYTLLFTASIHYTKLM